VFYRIHNNDLTPEWHPVSITNASFTANSGYYQIGKIIILSLRFQCTGSSLAVPTISGLPIDANNEYLIVNGYNTSDETSAYMFMGAGSRTLTMPSALAINNKNYAFSGIYVTT
jgi:hypothetical protein